MGEADSPRENRWGGMEGQSSQQQRKNENHSQNRSVASRPIINLCNAPAILVNSVRGW